MDLVIQGSSLDLPRTLTTGKWRSVSVAIAFSSLAAMVSTDADSMSVVQSQDLRSAAKASSATLLLVLRSITTQVMFLAGGNSLLMYTHLWSLHVPVEVSSGGSTFISPQQSAELV